MSQQAEAKAAFERELRGYVGLQIGPPEVAADPVNEAMIRHWCQAMSDREPIYTDPAAAARSTHGGIVAPPAMMQAWAMPGIVVAYDLETAAWIRDMAKVGIDSSREEVVVNEDGSVDIYFGPTVPDGKDANWIPTVEGRKFFLLFRFYGPEPAVFDGSFKLNDIERIN